MLKEIYLLMMLTHVSYTLKEKKEKECHCTRTVGGHVIACIKVIACGTSGDDFIHLKTSNIKFKVIYYENTVNFEDIHEKNFLNFFV